MANYKSLSGSRVSFYLEITKEDLKKNKKSTLDYFRNQIDIKGFRKGHVTDEIIMKKVSSQHMILETANRALDKKYRTFILENNLYPISPPRVQNFNPEILPCEVNIEVEVYPEINLGDYKKIKMPSLKIEVTEKDIDEVIETLLAQQEKGVRVDRASQKMDMVDIDFVGKDKKGNLIPMLDGKGVKVRLGLGHFIESFEKVILGMKPGEEKNAADVKLPEDYKKQELAGKNVYFDIKCNEVLEISAKNIDESTVEEIYGKKTTLDEFRKNLLKIIKQNKEESKKTKNIEEYKEKLGKLVKVELPESWIVDDLKARLDNLKNSPEFKNDPEDFWKNTKQTEESLKTIFRTQAEKDLKLFLALTNIVKEENIELNKDEVESAKQTAQERIEKRKMKVDLESETHRILLNLKIDKYLQSLTLKG